MEAHMALSMTVPLAIFCLASGTKYLRERPSCRLCWDINKRQLSSSATRQQTVTRCSCTEFSGGPENVLPAGSEVISRIMRNPTHLENFHAKHWWYLYAQMMKETGGSRGRQSLYHRPSREAVGDGVFRHRDLFSPFGHNDTGNVRFEDHATFVELRLK